MLKNFFNDHSLGGIVIKVVMFFLFLVFLYGGWLLATLVWFEIQPIHHGWDGLIYTAVGRAIVNGLVPYKDLFEFKPPGIFLMSASSLWLFDDIRLGNVLQGACYLGILFLLFTPLLSRLRLKHWKLDTKDILLWLSSAVLGMMSIFYLAARAGQFQTESFGAVFAVAFLVTMMTERKLTMTRLLLAAFFLACSVGMKESFLPAIFASTLIFFPIRESHRKFFLPLLLAVCMGIAALYILGYLDVYLSIYLPETLIGRASFNQFPIWTLAFDASLALSNIWAFSPYFLIAISILWMLSLVTMADGWREPRVQIALSVLITSFVSLYVFASSVITSDQQGRTAYFPQDPFFLFVFSTFLFFVWAWIALLFFFCIKDANRILTAFIRHCFAVILAFVSILVAGMLQQQFGTLVPLFAVMILSCTRSLSEMRVFSFPMFLFLSATVIASLGLIFLNPPDYSSLLFEQRKAQELGKTQAQQIDGLMTACGYDRYVIFGEPAVPFAYTHHSPFGPAFTRTAFTFPVKWRKPPIPYLQDTYRENLRSARFVIAKKVEIDGKTRIDSTDIPDDVLQIVERDFSVTAPSCAAPFHPSGDMTFLFRTQ